MTAEHHGAVQHAVHVHVRHVGLLAHRVALTHEAGAGAPHPAIAVWRGARQAELFPEEQGPSRLAAR